MSGGVESITMGGPGEAAPAAKGQAPNDPVEKVVVTEEEANKAKEQENPKPAGDRPEWLPEKFTSAEDMARAYKELESKIGGKPEEESKEEPAEKETSDFEIPKVPEGFDMDAVSKEFQENGELSEGTYEKFDKAGFDKTTVDTYIAGQKALADNQLSGLYDIVGSEGNLKSVLEWSRDNLPQGEIDAYNNALNSGDITQAGLLLRGIAAQHGSSEGINPDLVNGEGLPSSSGAKPFASQAQIVEAMRDPRYDKDPAYRDSVAARLNVTQMGG